MMANLNLALILGHPLFYRKYRVIFVRFVLNLEKRIFLSPIQFSIVQETINGRMDPLMVKLEYRFIRFSADKSKNCID